jgi:hypothetical protein
VAGGCVRATALRCATNTLTRRTTDECVPGKRAEELPKNFDHLATEERLYQWRAPLRRQRHAPRQLSRRFI